MAIEIIRDTFLAFRCFMTLSPVLYVRYFIWLLDLVFRYVLRKEFIFLPYRTITNDIIYIIVGQHGDLDLENKANDSFVPCITNIKSFGSTFQFSLETQHTIGYGQKLVIFRITSKHIDISSKKNIYVITLAYKQL